MNPDQENIFDGLIRDMDNSLKENGNIPWELKQRFVEELRKQPGSDEIIGEFWKTLGGTQAYTRRTLVIEQHDGSLLKRF